MHQISKPLLMSQYTTVTQFFFYSNMINKELKGLKRLLLLAHVDTPFTSAVKTEQPEVVPLYIG